jgi:hypothetical protein
MRKTILSAMLLSALAVPALADSYPVSGLRPLGPEHELG